MNTLTNQILSLSSKVLAIFVVVFTINSFIFLLLPKVGKTVVDNSVQQLPYSSVNLERAFTAPKPQEVIQPQPLQKDVANLFDLHAIYAYHDRSGWIMVSKKRSNEIHLIGQNEEFENYTLLRLYPDRVVFGRAKSEYELFLNQESNLASVPQPTRQQVASSTLQEVQVSSQDIRKYTTDFEAIWKAISIKELKDRSGNITGFEIMSIEEDSAFAQLGLKAKDVIQKVNNIDLTSYAAAFEIFNNIDNYRSLNIEILRDNTIMEITYEIE